MLSMGEPNAEVGTEPGRRGALVGGSDDLDRLRDRGGGW